MQKCFSLFYQRLFVYSFVFHYIAAIANLYICFYYRTFAVVKRPFLLLISLFFAVHLWAQPSEVRISEVLFNPRGDGADYVELYNAGSEPVSLATLRLARWKNDRIDRLYLLDSNYHVAVGEYVVLTVDAADVAARYDVRYMSRLIEVDAMPPLNNASGTVLVVTSDSVVIDRLDYDEEMHNPLLRDVDGVALERRSMERPSSERSNWTSAASTAGYGTPTYQNSQSREVLFLEDQFSVSADIVSPDGDGYQDLMDVTYQLRRDDLMASATIMDAQGRHVRYLLRNASLGTQGVVTWNGTDDNGARCRRGNYILMIETYNATNQRQVLKRSIVVQ